MILRGGGATGAACVAGHPLGIGLTFAGGCAAGEALPACAAGVVTLGGMAIAGGAVLEVPAGVVAAGGATGVLGGIPTTVGGRYPAATEAGVTILGAGGPGATTARLGGMPFAAPAFSPTPGSSTRALTGGRDAGWSATPFC